MINLVVQVGRLSKKPALVEAKPGRWVCNCAISVTEVHGGKEETCFIDFEVWGERAKWLNEYFKKGDGICLRGRLVYLKWEDKNGQKRAKHIIRVTSASFPPGKEPNGASPDQQPGFADGDGGGDLLAGF